MLNVRCVHIHQIAFQIVLAFLGYNKRTRLRSRIKLLTRKNLTQSGQSVVSEHPVYNKITH